MLDFVKNNVYIFLGVTCLLVVGVVFFVTSGTGGSRVVEDAIYGYTATHVPSYSSSPSIAWEQEQTAPPPLAQMVDELPAPAIEDTPRMIAIHIAGEVMNPGRIDIAYGMRVDDAVQMAGGPTEYADLDRINLAAFVRDAMQIIVPAIGQDIGHTFVYDETPETGALTTIATGLVNINTATLSELQTLPGIGPVIAQNIVDYRERHGGFSTIEELINVPRIGAVVLDGLRGLVYPT